MGAGMVDMLATMSESGKSFGKRFVKKGIE